MAENEKELLAEGRVVSGDETKDETEDETPMARSSMSLGPLFDADEDLDLSGVPRTQRFEEPDLGVALPPEFGPVGTGVYGLRRLRSAHRLIARLDVMGVKVREIATMLGRSEVGIKAIMKSDLYLLYRDELEKTQTEQATDILARLRSLAVDAVDEVERILADSDDDKLKAKVSFGILDRTFTAPKTADAPKAPQINLVGGQINLLMGAISEQRKYVEGESEPIDITSTAEVAP